jgi:uncharacterized membrane protein YhaH (DUF805 family)
MYCSSCGSQLTGVESFCSMCGSTTLSSPSLAEEQVQNDGYQGGYYGQESEKVNPWSTFFTKQGDFNGRANRAEFWVGFAYVIAWSFASLFFIGFFVAISDALTGLFSLFVLASGVYLTYLSVVLYIRRFHDMSQSGLLVLLYLIPFIGWIVFLFMGIKGSDPVNKYGSPRIS